MKDTTIPIRCNTETKEALKKIAKDKGLSLSSYLHMILIEEIKKVDKSA